MKTSNGNSGSWAWENVPGQQSSSILSHIDARKPTHPDLCQGKTQRSLQREYCVAVSYEQKHSLLEGGRKLVTSRKLSELIKLLKLRKLQDQKDLPWAYRKLWGKRDTSVEPPKKVSKELLGYRFMNRCACWGGVFSFVAPRGSPSSYKLTPHSCSYK